MTTGIIRENESVTWKAKHFGFWLHHTSKITGYDKPKYFQDSMTKGMFKDFVHDHHFNERDTHTEMIDTLVFNSPFGIIGRITDSLFLSNYLERLINSRNQTIKSIAESNSWQKYVDV